MSNKHKIGLGTVQFGLNYGVANTRGKTQPLEVKKIITAARKYNINTIDTASAYGDSEIVLGRNDLTNFLIVSKFMPPHDNINIEDQLKTTLKNLGVSSLHGYLAHRPLKLLEFPLQWEELKKLKEQKLTSKIGFSLNTPEEGYALLDKGVVPDIVQIPYNYFDCRFNNLIQELRNKGCEIHSRSTFLQGLFFLAPEKLSSFFEPVRPIIKNLQENYDNLAGSLLKHVVEKKFIDHVVIGVETADQLSQNIEAMELAKSLPPLSQSISKEILMPVNWPKIN